MKKDIFCSFLLKNEKKNPPKLYDMAFRVYGEGFGKEEREKVGWN